MSIERRFLARELRAERSDGQPAKIAGYAAVFNSLSEDLGGFREVIMPGAFSQAIQEDDVRALFNHDSSLILGRNTAGTLILSEDDVGLRYEITPPDTQYARDLLVSIGRGDVDRSSFGFMATEESWKHPTDMEPLPVRVLHRCRLFDVSPVTFPAYPETLATVRSKAIELGQAAGGAEDGTAGRLAMQRRKLNLIELS